jgi:AraC-like DNA-binding protein
MTTQLLKYTNRLRHADQLIRLEATGTPRLFAQKLGISESYLYGILDEMKDMGLPLTYSKTRLTYVYTKPVRLHIEIGVEIIAI